MHSTQPLLNRAENHSKAMNLGPLVFILCALVTVLSVLVGNLYHQQNQYRELLTNEAPVSKEIAVRSMAPMVMNHQTMFEGSHMDMSKLVAEKFTEDSGKYLRDLYREHFGEDDFEEEAVGVNGENRAKMKETFQKWFKNAKATGEKVAVPFKVMKKTVYALIRVILVMLAKLNIILDQVTAGTTGVLLQFFFDESAAKLAEKLDPKKDLAGSGEDPKTKSWYSTISGKVFSLLTYALKAYQGFVCNTGVQVKGFQIGISATSQLVLTMLFKTEPKIVKAFKEKFNADLSGVTDIPECANVHTNLVPDKDFKEDEFKIDGSEDDSFIPFECTDCDTAAESDLSGKQNSDRQS